MDVSQIRTRSLTDQLVDVVALARQPRSYGQYVLLYAIRLIERVIKHKTNFEAFSFRVHYGL